MFSQRKISILAIMVFLAIEIQYFTEGEPLTEDEAKEYFRCVFKRRRPPIRTTTQNDSITTTPATTSPVGLILDFYCQVSGTNITMAEPTGNYIESPFYGVNYLDFLTCNYQITAPVGKCVKTAGIDGFSLTNGDKVEIYDDQNLMETRESSIQPNEWVDISTTQRIMKILFLTDYAATSTGFKIYYDETDC